MKLHYLTMDDGTRLSFHATAGEALLAREWWASRGNADITVESLSFTLTKRGVAELLNRIAKSEG